jgi:hypothetical protein
MNLLTPKSIPNIDAIELNLPVDVHYDVEFYELTSENPLGLVIMGAAGVFLTNPENTRFQNTIL